MKQVYIGAHVSTAGGVSNAIVNAEAIGANAIQMFGSSPRQWKVRPIAEEEQKRFKEEIKRAGMGPVFIHAPYLINLASQDPQVRKKSETLLKENLRIAEQLDIEGVVFHVGSGKELPKEKAKKYVVDTMKKILKEVPGTKKLVLENSAGGGKSLGSTLEEMQEILDRVKSDRAAACFDTAHALESGVLNEYTEETVNELAKQVGKTIGWDRLVAVHLNDSRSPANSNYDRHENIGEGYIGKKGIEAFVNHPKFQRKPWYLEVPGFDNKGPDKKNIDRVKRLVHS